MRHTLPIATLLSLLLLTACAGSGGFQQQALREATAQARPPQVNDGEIAHALGLRAQLPKPYRLGVYFREPPQSSDNERLWRWEGEHRTAIMKRVDALEASDEVSAVFTIARATVVNDDLRSIRVDAARHGADAVLVVSGDSELQREANLWAISYLALVPVLFAPAQELQARFTAHAELWDVRNEYLYLAAEAESSDEQMRPLPFINSVEATAIAQREAIDLLAVELERRVQRVHHHRRFRAGRRTRTRQHASGSAHHATR